MWKDFAGQWMALWQRPQYRKRLRFWVLFMATIPVAITVTVLVSTAYFSQGLPSLEQLERIEPSLISRVYDKDSILLHEFYVQRRIWTPIQQIPQLQKQAVFAIEDQEFHSHWGVDLGAYPGALLPVVFGKRARGASTLTQQLAKNLFLTPERSVARKIRELLLAIQIEKTYTKEEILEFYFNQVYLGGGAYGFQAAAQRYFNRPLDSLRVSEHAILAGLLQRPEAYRPDRNPELSRERRNTVLRAMRGAGYIDKKSMVASLAEPIQTENWEPENNQAAYFVETIRQFMEKEWGEDFIYRQGVKVYSTLDQELQQVAESSMVAHLQTIQRRIRYRTARMLDMPRRLKTPLDTIVRHWNVHYQKFDSLYLASDTAIYDSLRRFPDSLRYRHAQAAVVVIDNETGAVRALVGGEDFDVSKYNRAIQALRSPGSAFKPFVYAAAVDNGASPGNVVEDQPITIPDPEDTTKAWRPHNYEDKFEGAMTMRRALYRSKNLPAIQVGLQYGLGTVVSYARKFGLAHRVPAVPSLSIGTCEATLLEMTSAYSTFPNLGVRPAPFFVQSIADRKGSPVYQNIPKTYEVLRKPTAWIMCTMLQDVNVRGTGAQIWASGFHHPSGGKTGTTNNYTDAWYVGFTKQYTCGVWVGADNHVPLGPGHSGSRDALPIWLAIMERAHKGLPKQELARPEGVVRAMVCPKAGMATQAFCENMGEDFFVAGYQPDEDCAKVCDDRPKVTRGANLFNAKQSRFEQPEKKEDTGTSRVRKTF